MKIGMFGYPGDHVERTHAMVDALKDAGAKKIVCLGGLIWSGRRGEDDQGPPATVLRWLRNNDIPTLANDTDRQIAGWRLQALDNITGYIQPRVRKILSALTREEAQWLYSRPSALPIEKVLCCSDSLTIDALYPAPLTSYNANKLFGVLEQTAAIFPSANGPSLIVTKETEKLIEASTFDGIDVRIDARKFAAIIGGIAGTTPLNSDVSWGAIVDSEATQLSMLCLDAKTLKKVPERGAILIQRSELNWRG
ncbi:MAG TPA: hypothetical protein VEK08_08370 [Planctomycetota bacterium]|nr:hypothetical protein [Planctomycetota bacterium]